MPEQITKHTSVDEALLSSVSAESTTAALAGKVPLEKNVAEDVPGAFPETPGTEPLSFSVKPIPASESLGNPIDLAPGEPVPDPSTLTSNTVSSTVHDDLTLANAADDSQQKFSVNPIPATAGGGNPISLAPGEKVPDPSQFTTNTIDSTVRTDKESYENSDALGVPPVLPPVAAESVEQDTGVLDLPPISKNMIPESSLPIGTDGIGTFDASPFIQSVGSQSTTAQLAGQVPLEPKQPSIPDDVKDAGDVEPEASAVPETPITSDDTTVAAKSADKEEAAEATVPVESSANGAIAPAVPDRVKESTVEPGEGFEVTASAKPDEEKVTLSSQAKPENSTGEPIPKPIDAPAALSPPEASQKQESRDISPTTVPGSHFNTGPAVTTGVASDSTDKTSSTPDPPTTPTTSAAPSSGKAADGQSPASLAATDKKKKRFSFLTKLKEKLSDKKDKH